MICDAPARQLIKGIKGHTGYHACERCQVEGQSIQRRMTFCETDCPPRTENEFRNYAYKDTHQIEDCPLLGSTGINLIRDFVLDYQHLVCLGVMKRILYFLKEGPRECKLSTQQVNLISQKLVSCSLPSEIARQPRSLVEVKRWKATEFRSFLCYTGVVAFRSQLSKEMYIHFLSLVIAVRIMLNASDEFRNENINYAKELIKYFVEAAPEYYGLTFVVYNVHSLVHLHEDIEHFRKPLNKISCFPFENHLQAIKKLVRNSSNPIAQIAKRISELDNIGRKEGLKNTAKVSNSKKDKWFTLENGDIASVVEKRNDIYVCCIIKSRYKEDFFLKPCCSSIFGIYFVKHRNMEGTNIILKQDHFKIKLVGIEVDEGYVFIEMLHNIH